VKKLIKEAAQLLYNSKMTLALTGAGISVESGIPDFRSAQGLWSKYDPNEYATITAFRAAPEKVWAMLRDMGDLVEKAEPNKAHVGMGELENLGFLHTIVTQNVDSLHQKGGAKSVIEYHGNSSTLTCISCGEKYRSEDKRKEHPPLCRCKRILKPDVIFFGERIPAEALNRSFQLAATSQVLMVAGTSATVSPANTIPSIAKENGAKIIEINMEKTLLTEHVTDIFIQGSTGEIIEDLVGEIKSLISAS
jgi:NAD-dependent deacetylase